MPECAPPPTVGAAPQSGGCPASGAPRSTPSLRWPKPTLPTGRRRPHRPKSTGAEGTAYQFYQNQLGSIPVLDIGGVNHYGQKQAHGVHYDVALAPEDFFTCVISAMPPFSVVFTDWLSMMAALGVASRPSASRTRRRNASSTRSQVPSLRHFRKYHQTVPQGGRSWGMMRQVMPSRNTCNMLFTISRKSTVRGCPRDVFGATKEPTDPIARRSNRWDTLFVSYPRGRGYARSPAPPASAEATSVSILSPCWPALVRRRGQDDGRRVPAGPGAGRVSVGGGFWVVVYIDRQDRRWCWSGG